ncbi:tail fiber assembly protein [Arsenophonus endosymbiont of Crataerina pallida]|uniref:tail fiber assembly protein n=1 Tax=Arsenophonus endosymbiont of Crataerina pallida TaxID=3066235 RepID=UPI0030D13F82
MRYSLEITNKNDITESSITKLGESGFAISDGYMLVYEYLADSTREYSGARYRYVSENTRPGYGYALDAPVIPDNDELAIIRSEDHERWLYVPDHRGKTVYNTDDQSYYTVDYPGEIKTGFTLLAPKTPFDYWDGDKWVTDKEAEKKDAIQSAKYEKRYRIDRASEIIQPLQDAVDLDMATEEEKIQLRSWKLYRLNLHRKDISIAPDIEWPEKPN